MNPKALPPTVLVILGATGDLTRRKILPALNDLYRAKALPPRFRVVGFSRREISNEMFRQQVFQSTHSRDEEFLDIFSYQQGFFDRDDDYAALSRKLESIDESWGVCTNKLFYLAVPPSLYGTIAPRIARSKLSALCESNAGMRIIVEKPFGNDAKTAAALDALLGRLFTEEQIYRIDHYLGKEMMQNILSFRFANNLFEPSWNNRHIESIAVRFLERIGLEGRGSFYEAVGALRDVGQNHLLQMLALTTMENPGRLEAKAVRRNRAALLGSLRRFSAREVEAHSVRAQYEGYRAEEDVSPESETETYFKLTAHLDAPRWEGVPITLEAGKNLPEARKEVEVVFKHPAPCLCPPGTHFKNSLIFAMEPEERITVRFWSKTPGLASMELQEKDFELQFESAGSRAYEKLLMDCIAGDQMLFVGSAEVAAGWSFVDSIIAGWRKNLAPLQTYRPGTLPLPSEKSQEVKALPKTIGIIGLGKMGSGLARQLLEKGWRVVGWNRTAEVAEEIAKDGLIPAATPADLLRELSTGSPAPRLIWLMLPAGKVVDEMLFGRNGLARQLKRGDIVIDGGNSFYKDSVRRAKRLKTMGINFLDAGVSGGPGGARNGATVMVGGEARLYNKLEELFRDMSVAGGYAHAGKAGAGHFVKMVHNGIEYGMMQSIAEGFAIMKKSGFKPDLVEIAQLYNHGSVIESRLIGWLDRAYEEWGPDLKGISGKVAYTGEGEWTVKAAKELGVSAPVIADAFKFRVRSQRAPSYTGRILSALRNQFGGHAFRAGAKRKDGKRKKIIQKR